MNLGVIGAVGGAAKGFDSFITEEQKAKRAQTLDNLRASNNQETNRQNNEQRAAADKDLLQERNKNDISLENLRSQNTMSEQAANNAAIADRPTNAQKNLQEMLEMGMDNDDIVDRLFPKGGRTGSSQLDVNRDKFKAMLDMVNNETYPKTPQEAEQAVAELMESSGLAQKTAPAHVVKMLGSNPSDLQRQQFDQALQAQGIPGSSEDYVPR